MSDQLGKPKFVRKLEFGGNNSENNKNKLKSCKIVQRGGTNHTLPINLNSSFASLKNNCFSEENPFLSCNKTNKQSISHRLFDAIPACSKSEPKLKSIKIKGKSPKISSTSKIRLKINRYNKKDAILNRKKVNVTTNSITLNSPKIKQGLNSPRNSKFAVSCCLETEKSSKFGHSPSFKRQANISWKETDVDGDLNAITISSPKSPSFVVPTPLRKKEIFQRSKLINNIEEKSECEKQVAKKIGIDSEFLKIDPKKRINLSPIIVFKTGETHSNTEREKSPNVLKKLSPIGFSRLSKTPDKLFLSSGISNQDLQPISRNPEPQLKRWNVQKSPIVGSIDSPRIDANITKKKESTTDSSPIIKLGSLNQKIVRNKIIEIRYEENEKIPYNNTTPIKDGTEEMIIDSPLDKTNLIKRKRKKKISARLKSSKLKRKLTPKSPLLKINDKFPSSPEIIKSSPVLSKNCKSILKKFPQCKQNVNNENNETTSCEPNDLLIKSISPKCMNFRVCQNNSEFNNSSKVFPRNGTSLKSIEKVKREVLETQENLSTLFSENSPRTSLCKSPEMSLVQRKILVNDNKNISFSDNSPKLSVCKSPEMLLLKRKSFDNPGKTRNISLSENSFETSLCKSTEITSLKRKRLAVKNDNCYPSSIGVSPKCINSTDFWVGENISEINNTPKIIPLKERIIEPQNRNDSISFGEYSPKSSLSKSPEISFMKRKNAHDRSLNCSISDSPTKSAQCESLEMSSLKRKNIYVENDSNLKISLEKNSSLIKTTEDSTPSKTGEVKKEHPNSSFVTPNLSLINVTSPKCFNSNNLSETLNNKSISELNKSPEVYQRKRKSFESDNNRIKRKVIETDRNSTISAFCKSPEISTIKRTTVDPEVFSIKRKNIESPSPVNIIRNILETESGNLNLSFNPSNNPLRKYNEDVSIKNQQISSVDSAKKDINNKNTENSPKTVSSEITNSPFSISSSPLINKLKNKKVRVLFSSKESCRSAQDAAIESPSETSDVPAQIFLKKGVDQITKIGLETQLIDEFHTETLHLIATKNKNGGWSSEASLSEILSEEKSRQSKSDAQSSSQPAPVAKPSKRKKPKAKESMVAQLDAARNSLLSERRIREYERKKNGECLVGSKVFHVTQVWGRNPQKLEAITDEGDAMLILGEGLVYSPDDIKPGCIIRIYPPWQTLTSQQGLTIYLSIRMCDILPGTLHEDAQCFINMEEEIPIDPYLKDPNRIIKVLLNEPDSEK